MKRLKVCFIGANSNFEGGIPIFQKNLIKYIRSKKILLDITWIYPGAKDQNYIKEDIRYIEIKSNLPYPFDQYKYNNKVAKFLENNYFDIINSHAVWGYWMKNYRKKKNQKIVHTYHGITYYFFKNHTKRKNLFIKLASSLLAFYGKNIEAPPWKNADKIICVSAKVKREAESIYGKRRNIGVIRTGVDLKEFKPRDKSDARKELGLEKRRVYGLYIGRGGWWTKGLDRAMKLSEEIFKANHDYRLIVIGPEYEKTKHLLDKNFVSYLPVVKRDKIPSYCNASDIFFCLSRYEGGAPTLAVSEAMASGCLVVCSKDSEQEIIKNMKNGIIIKNYNKGDAEKILAVIYSKGKKTAIINNSIKTIKECSLEKWGRKYLNALLG